MGAVRTESRVRNYGIDLLKLFSMLMIVFLHVLGAAGVLDNLSPGTMAHDSMWLLEAACYGAVNCFALTTGYLMVDRSPKAYRLLELWLQVAFYTVGVTLFFSFWRPEVVTPLYWKAAFRPVTALHYWYFTAYFAMYLFIPFYNKLIAVLSQKELQRLIACCLVLPLLTVLAKDDIFRLHGGYTMVWLSILYVIGAYFKKYPIADRWGTGRWLLVYLAASLATWAGKMITVRSGDASSMAAMLLNYISPTVVLGSVALFQAFLKLPITNHAIQKCIARMAPAAFGVYLLHCHPLIWHQLIVGRFTYFAAYALPKLAAAVVVSGVVIWLLSLLIDMGRIMLFRLLRVEAFCKRLTEWCGSLADRRR